jgi:diguanylate cyclase (GGDEF)-like protein
MAPAAARRKNRLGKRRGIAATVVGGLVVLLISLTMVSALGLGAFYSFRSALKDLSDSRVPRIIQGSRLAEWTNRLIFEVERLVGSDSDASRRIASADLRSQLSEIAALLETEEFAQSRQMEAFRVLESNLTELDALIESRIKVNIRNEGFHELLLKYPANAIRLLMEIQSTGGSGISSNAEAVWLDEVMEIVSIAGAATGQTSLSQIGQSEQIIKRSIDALKASSARSPPPFGKRVERFQDELENALLGTEGVIALLKERATISRQTAGKSNFCRSLAGDFRATSAVMFNELVTAAADNAYGLSRIVNRTLAAFIAALSAAAIAFLVVTLHFRRHLILRLVNLNAAILRRVAGTVVPLTAEGDDEISDMTRSFLYYEDEVNMREMALKEMATTDPLTGISNRRHFLESAGAELERAERFGRPLTLLMLDIDLFKRINDSHGHPVGDVVIKSVVSACRARIRKVDLFGRIGGEEFAVLMPEADNDMGFEVAQRIREEVERMVCEVGELRLTTTVSIGVASASQHGYGIVELMKSADAAMYVAKNSGRNQVKAEA